MALVTRLLETSYKESYLKISLIAAIAEDRVIGMNNKLPWTLPADLAWFKKNTLNKPIVMGRKTWESLPFKPLPGRDNIIITHNKDYPIIHKKNESEYHTIICSSIDKAIAYAHQQNHQELMCIGGAMLYRQLLKQADCLYLTLVKGHFDGDAWFPEIDFSHWQQSYSEVHEPNKDNPHHYQFTIYQRKSL